MNSVIAAAEAGVPAYFPSFPRRTLTCTNALARAAPVVRPWYHGRTHHGRILVRTVRTVEH